MTSNEQIAADMKAAMKSGDKLRVSTLRLLRSEIKYAEIRKGESAGEEDIVSVVGREIKKRREAAEQFRQGGRPDAADKEEAEAAILQEYLPEQLSDGEIAALVDEAIAQTGAAGPGDMGKVMGVLMPKVKGKADGAAVSAMVKEKLSPRPGMI